MHGITRWDDLRVLLACIEHGSLTAAAHALGLQQSTVSRRLAALERDVGAPLFIRTPEGVSPTPLALSLRPDADAMAQHLHAIQRTISGHDPAPRGLVTLSLVEPVALFLLLPHLSDLSLRYPDLRLNLINTYHDSDLTRGDADIALRFARPSAGDLVSKRIASLPLAVLASQTYLDAHGPPTTHSGRWVTVPLPSIPTVEQRWFETHIKTPPWLQTTSYVTAAQAIASGLAAGITIAQMIHIFDQKIVDIDVGVAPPPPLEIWLVSHRATRQTSRVDALWRWLDEIFSRLSLPASAAASPTLAPRSSSSHSTQR